MGVGAAARQRVLAWFLLALSAQWLLAGVVRAIDTTHTSGIFGAIQFVDRPTTVTRLLEQCFAGFALNGCTDLNATTSKHRKSYEFASQFTDPLKRNQQYCLQCCTKPTPRVTGADETWNLSCPMNDLQRLSVSKGSRTFRFARRDTLEDETIIECVMPNRTQGTYLRGYEMTLWVIERSQDFGTKFWTSVINCSLSITETATPPTRFSEVIRVRSIPTPQPRPTGWILPFVLSLLGGMVMLSIPIYKGGYLGQRCLHCASKLVFVKQMCLICIFISCKLRPPAAKVYVRNGDPKRLTVVEENDGDDESDDSESESDEDEEDEKTRRISAVKNIKTAKSWRNR